MAYMILKLLTHLNSMNLANAGVRELRKKLMENRRFKGVAIMATAGRSGQAYGEIETHLRRGVRLLVAVQLSHMDYQNYKVLLLSRVFLQEGLK